MDAVTAVSGSGPAYVFLLAEALARAGAAAGLPRELAAKLARATVAGSGELLNRSPLDPATLRAERHLARRHHRGGARRADGARRPGRAHEQGRRGGDAGARASSRAKPIASSSGPIGGLDLQVYICGTRGGPPWPAYVEVASWQRRPPTGPKPPRERIIDAFMALLAEKPIERIGFAEIATRAEVSLADLRDEFGSTLAILAAHMKEIDRAVLRGGDADMAEEPARERLFDVLMRRHRGARAAQAGGALAGALGRLQSSLAIALNGLGCAFAAMDADRRRHFGVRAERHGARAGTRPAVRLGAAHLGRRRRPRPRPHPGGARSRAGTRPALVGHSSTTCAQFQNACAGRAGAEKTPVTATLRGD